jgi:NTP pyrophosphatase (non-canonical NTP hydrolase)
MSNPIKSDHPLDILARRCHRNAKEKGFWPPEGRNKAEMMMLEVSEIAERLEAVRSTVPLPSSHLPAYSAEEEEVADLIIRVMDYAVGHSLRLGDAFDAKMAYNAGRPYKHGKEF